MNTTSQSLMDRLRRPADAGAWERFVRLYTPLLFHWGRRAGLPEADAADLVQDVLTLLVQKMPAFRYEPGQSFRGWLRTVTMNKWRDGGRRRNPAAPVADTPAVDALPAAAPDPFEEVEYRRHLVSRALRVMQAEFEPTTWKACWEFVVSDRPAAEVAAELGVSVDVVYAAKSRVLRRLREELAGLLD